MIAALYVETGGTYYGLPGVDPWDIERDARNYRGPWPVVAHPPCNRWSVLAAIHGTRDGADGGCFEHALWAVRTFGGVLEQPAQSLAWQRFNLPAPASRGWVRSLTDPGWSCRVDQRRYGFPARKPTWLYFVGDDPPHMRWGPGPKSTLTVETMAGGSTMHRRSRTPPYFAAALLNMAEQSLHTAKEPA